MTPNVVLAYARHGYRVDLGNPSIISARLIQNGSEVATGGGIPVAATAVFFAISRVAPELSSWFIVGNAFGYSTLVLADLFPRATIDVIDAETEGAANKTGSSLTRQIALESFPQRAIDGRFLTAGDPQSRAPFSLWRCLY